MSPRHELRRLRDRLLLRLRSAPAGNVEPAGPSAGGDRETPGADGAGRRHLFVTGVQRSGTSALTTLLNAHSQIAIGMERYKYLYRGDPADVGPHLFDDGRFFDIQPSETNIGMAPHYRALRGKFSGVAYVGDKMPGLVDCFPLLMQRFASPRFVYIFRDPAFVAASWQARADNPNDPWPAQNDAMVAVKSWNAEMERVIAFAQAHPGLLVPIGYEHLFSGAPDALDRLLHHLGLPPDAALTQAHAAMTAGWSERSVNPPRLDRRRLDHVRRIARADLTERFERLACAA